MVWFPSLDPRGGGSGQDDDFSDSLSNILSPTCCERLQKADRIAPGRTQPELKLGID